MKNGDQDRKSVTAGIGELISRHPGKIVVLFLAITVWMALPLKNLNTSTKMSDYLPECEYLDTDKKMREYFEASKSVVSILTAESGDIMTRQGLIVLRDIEQSIEDSELVGEYLISDDRAVDTVGGDIGSCNCREIQQAIHTRRPSRKVYEACYNQGSGS